MVYVLSSFRGGEELSEILDIQIDNNRSHITFFVNTSKNSSLNARDSSFWRFFWGRNFSFNLRIIRLNWTKLCPPKSANIWGLKAHAWLCCDSTDFRSFPETRNHPKLFSSQDIFDWIIELDDWADDALIDGEFRHEEKENVAKEGCELSAEWNSHWLCQLEEEGRSSATNGSQGTPTNDTKNNC